MDELLIKLTEIIEDLVKLNKVTINLLAQYMSVEEFEEKLKKNCVLSKFKTQNKKI